MKILEEQIWNTITDSAKTKFDFESFAKDFDEIDENIAENILFKTIVNFASDKSIEIITEELFNDFLLMGLIWEKSEIYDFLIAKKQILTSEIFASKSCFYVSRKK